VDVAVIEAGCGGRFDLTNFLDPAASVVTCVGMDHAMSLGPGIDDIAWHKAGILKPGVPAVTGAAGSPLEIVRKEAAELGCPLEVVTPPDGPFWEINHSIARATLAALRDTFDVSEEHITQAASIGRLPARRERVPEPEGDVIIDGAHNADKMAAFVRTIEPGAVFVIGCLLSKNPEALIDAIKPAAAAVVTTEPSVYAKPPTPASELASACEARGLTAHAESDPRKALERALDIAGPNGRVVVTGSLYLVGEVRNRWYPWERVVLQRTSWPT